MITLFVPLSECGCNIKVDLHLNEYWVGGVTEFRPPAGRQQQLHLGPVPLRKGHFSALHFRQSQFAKLCLTLLLLVEQRTDQAMISCVMDPGQRQAWAFANQHVVSHPIST